jgi:hypothetical protein
MEMGAIGIVCTSRMEETRRFERENEIATQPGSLEKHYRTHVWSHQSSRERLNFFAGVDALAEAKCSELYR